MYNKVILIGKLGKDPEIKEVNGNQLANLTVSTWHSRKVNDEWKQDTTWHNVTVWGKAVLAVQKCRKGDNVYVEGEIRNDEYTDKNGFKVHTSKIVGFAKPIRASQNELQKIYSNNYSQPQQGQYAPQPQTQAQQDDVGDLPTGNEFDLNF